MLTVLRENFNCYFQGLSVELEGFLSPPALSQSTMELYPPFPDLFGFHSPLWRAIPTHARISMRWCRRAQSSPLPLFVLLVIWDFVFSNKSHWLQSCMGRDLIKHSFWGTNVCWICPQGSLLSWPCVFRDLHLQKTWHVDWTVSCYSAKYICHQLNEKHDIYSNISVDGVTFVPSCQPTGRSCHCPLPPPVPWHNITCVCSKKGIASVSAQKCLGQKSSIRRFLGF